MVTISASLSTAASRCTTRVGMIATYSATSLEAVVLGQHAAGAGELTKLVRVDTSHRQPRCEQGTDDPALVTTARLKANRGDRERAQPCDQLGPAGCVVTHRKEP